MEFRPEPSELCKASKAGTATHNYQVQPVEGG
jgi:hypothetical protein